MPVVVNFLLFQLGWLLCVWSGAGQMPWLGVSAAVLITATHLHRVRRPRTEFALITAVAALGFAWDSALVTAGLITYPSGNLIAGAAPVWIVAMWVLFGTTLNVSLRWLRDRLWLAALLGAAGGPSAYYAGAQLGGATLIDTPAALLAQAIGWTLILPLLLILARRLDGTWSDPVREVPECSS